MFSFFLIQGTVILLFGNGLLDHANKKPVASWCMASGHIWGYIHLHLSCADLEKGKRSRADPKDPDPIPWISRISSIQKKPKNKQRNKKKKNKPQTNKQNKTHENYSSEPPPPVLDPCMLDTLIPFRFITR